MKSKLDILLESISPERTIQKTYNRANEAINSFSFCKARIETWDEFMCCMARFLKHLNERVLNLTKPIDVPSEDYWKYCIVPLLKIYGSNGDVTAFTIASSGNEGGLYAVIKTFAMYKAEEYTKKEILSRVYDYWQELSADEKLEAAEEYLSKYKDIIPSDMFEEYAPLIKGYFWKFLQKHPFIVQKLNRIGL